MEKSTDRFSAGHTEALSSPHAVKQAGNPELRISSESTVSSKSAYLGLNLSKCERLETGGKRLQNLIRVIKIGQIWFSEFRRLVSK